ncbi:MAG: Cof-type HAD-IIB family hydrolase [Erysipelotrichaceae bacterium]
MIKIAFFDVDGTLIDMKKRQITEKMVTTLQLLQKKGIKICVATGRAPYIVPKIEGVHFDCYLTFNGSYCYTDNEEIFCNPICNQDVQKIILNAQEIGLPVLLATKTTSFANGCEPNLKEYMAISKQEVNVIDNFRQASKDEIYQMMIGCNPAQYDTILKDTENVAITAWWDKAADVIPLNGSKGLGVSKVLDYFHFKKEEAIAFGDGSNDLEMLQSVSTSVAMANGTDDIKEIASYVCPSVTEDGIYTFCKQHNLI